MTRRPSRQLELAGPIDRPADRGRRHRCWWSPGTPVSVLEVADLGRYLVELPDGCTVDVGRDLLRRRGREPGA